MDGWEIYIQGERCDEKYCNAKQGEDKNCKKCPMYTQSLKIDRQEEDIGNLQKENTLLLDNLAFLKAEIIQKLEQIAEDEENTPLLTNIIEITKRVKQNPLNPSTG